MSDEVVHLLTGASGGIISARCGVTAKSERKLPSTFSSWASDVTCTSCVPADLAEAKKAAAEAQAAKVRIGDVTLTDLAKQVFGI